MCACVSWTSDALCSGEVALAGFLGHRWKEFLEGTLTLRGTSWPLLAVRCWVGKLPGVAWESDRDGMRDEGERGPGETSGE